MLDEETLLTHLLQAAQDGLVVDPDWILTPGQQRFLTELIAKNAEVSPTDSLPEGITREHVALFRQIRGSPELRSIMEMMD